MSCLSDKHMNDESCNKAPINPAPLRHSTVVGGSTAARVMACPGSVKLCQQVPPIPPTDAAREGSMLHAAIARIIEENLDPMTVLAEGFSFDGVELTQELYDEKLLPAVQQFDALLDELEGDDTATILVESEVSFGDYIPGAFGSCDILVRCGPRVVVLDWKFGDFSVGAEENKQLMFYTAAAMRTPKTKHMFDDATDVELVIIQPTRGEPSRWVTTFPALTKFEKALKKSVADTTTLKQGTHCRWCDAQPICPLMTGAMERALKMQLENIGVEKLGLAFEQSYILESFIEKLRALVQTAKENGVDVPGCKLVQKKATRKWVDEERAGEVCTKIVADYYMQTPTMAELLTYETKLKSPAQMEKQLKKCGAEIPPELIVKESTGTTVVRASDPRPSVDVKVNLLNALAKIQP